MTNTKFTAAVHAPHLPRADYSQAEQDRQAYSCHIFDYTTVDFGHIEAMLALSTCSTYRQHALIPCDLKTGIKVLDVVVGTGLVAAQACVTPDQVIATLSAAGLTQIEQPLKVGVFSEHQATKANISPPAQTE